MVSLCYGTAQATMFLLLWLCCDTAQAMLVLLVSVCCDTAQAMLFLLVSVCCDTAQAMVFLLATQAMVFLMVSLCYGTAQATMFLLLSLCCDSPSHAGPVGVSVLWHIPGHGVLASNPSHGVLAGITTLWHRPSQGGSCFSSKRDPLQKRKTVFSSRHCHLCTATTNPFYGRRPTVCVLFSQRRSVLSVAHSRALEIDVTCNAEWFRIPLTRHHHVATQIRYKLSLLLFDQFCLEFSYSLVCLNQQLKSWE